MIPAIRISGILALSMLVFSGTAEAKKRKKKRTRMSQWLRWKGWQQQEGWTHGCYYPPNFEALGGMARQDAGMNGLMRLRLNGRAIEMMASHLVKTSWMRWRSLFWPRPPKLKSFSKPILEHCLKSAQGQGANEWGAWLRSQPAQLTEGECYNGLSYTLVSVVGNHRFLARRTSSVSR